MTNPPISFPHPEHKICRHLRKSSWPVYLSFPVTLSPIILSFLPTILKYLLFLTRDNNEGSFFSDSCYLLTYLSTRVLSHTPHIYPHRSNFESVPCNSWWWYSLPKYIEFFVSKFFLWNHLVIPSFVTQYPALKTSLERVAYSSLQAGFLKCMNHAWRYYLRK
jgi:hypothetical protein